MYCLKFCCFIVLALAVASCNNKKDDDYYDETSYIQKNTKDSIDRMKALLASGNKPIQGTNGLLVPSAPAANTAANAGSVSNIPVGQVNGGRITYTPEQVQAFTSEQLQEMQDKKMFTPEQVTQIKQQQEQVKAFNLQMKNASSKINAGQPVAAVGKGLNPAHGQPGHRCDISPGAPLNSKPNKPITANVQPGTSSSIPLAPITYQPLGDSAKQ